MTCITWSLVPYVTCGDLWNLILNNIVPGTLHNLYNLVPGTLRDLWNLTLYNIVPDTLHNLHNLVSGTLRDLWNLMVYTDLWKMVPGP